MKITYYGHACLGVEIQTSGQLAPRHLLFDPWITANPKAGAIDVDAIPADYILITHGHEDHLGDAVRIARRTGAQCLANFEIANWLEAQGVKNLLPMNIGGTASLDFGRVKLVRAVHSSSLPGGAYGGTAGGFVVETEVGNFYHSGDTALTMDMQLIGRQTKLNWAALCLGDRFTMGLQDALRAAEFIRCDQIIGLHYDTFPPIEIDQSLARKLFATEHKTLFLMPVGATREI